MTIKTFETEQELEHEFERIEELNFEHLHLKEAVKDAEEALKEAEEELQNFEEDNKEVLIH